MPNPTFKSKVDTWIVVVLLIIPVSMVYMLFAMYRTGDPTAIITGWVSVATVPAIYFGLVMPLVYELAESQLVVRAGLTRMRRYYADIVSVTPTRNPLSSPALSLDRLCIATNTQMDLMISPEDKQAFLMALSERCPHLRLDGVRLAATED